MDASDAPTTASALSPTAVCSGRSTKDGNEPVSRHEPWRPKRRRWRQERVEAVLGVLDLRGWKIRKVCCLPAMGGDVRAKPPRATA